MAAPQNYDNEAYIVEHVFTEVYEETLVGFGHTDRDLARELIFAIQERRKGGKNFAEVKSQIVLEAVPEEATRSRYHSLLTKYFKRLHKVPRAKKVSATTRSTDRQWRQLATLCARERTELDRQGNSNIITPDGDDLGWAPEYEGPVWED